MNYDTQDIVTINSETAALLEELRSHVRNVADFAARSGLKGSAGTEMQRVVNALNDQLREAEGKTGQVSQAADEKEGTQKGSDSTVSGIIAEQ